jgi:hypothetical protein
MTKFGLLLGVLFFSFNLFALPKASDFKDVGSEDESATEDSNTKTTSSEGAKPAMAENEELVSGTVRVIRKLTMTEVFFKDLKDSYFIPSGMNYSSIYKACQESEKKGSPVGLKVNTKSRRILSVESSAVKSPAAGGAESKTTSGSGGTK